MKTKLTDLQKAYLHDLVVHQGLTVGSHSPKIKRTFDALVDKGRAIRTELNPGWFKYVAVPAPHAQ